MIKPRMNRVLPGPYPDLAIEADKRLLYTDCPSQENPGHERQTQLSRPVERDRGG